MATTYGLKYTSGNITRNGVTYELRILRRGYTGQTLEIGDIQQLGLEVQGGSGGIDQPIIKTLLHFTVVDSVDMGTVDGVKHGGWEEFYTPDATLYLVRLLREGVIIWSGFITPDAWSDSLVYRGSITITARDNVGHIADFEFSKDELLTWMEYLGGTVYARVQDENLVSIYELLFAAFRVAGVDMPLRHQWDADDTGKEPHLKAGTYDVLDWLIDIDALQDMSWYEAIEKVLASAGLALRWCGKDGICLTSLRALHKMGQADAPVLNVNFVNRSGHRTLDPAYKQIVEKLSYDPVEGFEAQWAAGDFTTTERGYWQPVSSLTSNSKWTQANAAKEVLRYGSPAVLPVGSDVVGEEDKYVLLAGRPARPVGAYNISRAAYIDLDNYVLYRKRLSPGTIVSVGFEVAHTYEGDGTASTDANLPAGTIRYAVLWRKLNGTYLSLSGETWAEGESRIEVAVAKANGTDRSDQTAVAVSSNFMTPDVPGFLELRIYPYEHYYGSHTSTDHGSASTDEDDMTDAHVRLGDITFDVNTEAIPRYFKTTTVYDPAQNKTLKREVDFGAVPTRFKTAGTIRNGFYKPDAANGYPSIMDCHWDGDSTELPLPVLNHLQILSLHAKANSVLTGELRDADGRTIRMDATWQYAGRTFLLLSGTWNILSDRIQNAILREYDTYAAAIGSISANYTTDLSGGDARLLALQKSVNAAASLARNAGGSEEGGGGGGTGTVTSVGLSMPDAFSVTGSPVTGAGTIAVALQSGYTIPSTTLVNRIPTAAQTQHWETAYQQAHTHNNKLLLDTITRSRMAAWDAAGGGGGGSVVSISDLQQNGTKVATVTIDGTDYAIRVPGDTIDVSIDGTAAAPTLRVELGSGAYDYVAIPIASSSQSGIVSTSAQTFAGAKTFDRIYLGTSQSAGAYIEWDATKQAFKIVGDVYATGDVAAGE